MFRGALVLWLPFCLAVNQAHAGKGSSMERMNWLSRESGAKFFFHLEKRSIDTVFMTVISHIVYVSLIG